VTDGVNGWLVPEGPDLMHTRLRALRDDGALRDRMSAAAVASSLRYEWGRIADEQFEVFAAAAADVNHRPPRSASH